jgi:cytoskeletal protein CcmA (bactofilin family)
MFSQLPVLRKNMLAYDGGGCMCGSQTEARGDVQTTKYSLGGGVHGSRIYTHVTVQLHMGGLQCHYISVG